MPITTPTSSSPYRQSRDIATSEPGTAMRDPSSRGLPSPLTTIPPHTFFLISALFHYLGPAFAVLLFDTVGVLGVAWLRIASAALVFAVWRRPWRLLRQWSARQRRDLILLGGTLGAMNVCFYLAIARLPLGTVGAIEFLGPIVLAVIGVRTRHNVAALMLAIGGVWLLTDVRLSGEPLGFVAAFANCALFTLYIVLGHRTAQASTAPEGKPGGGATSIDRLAASMLIALIVATPIGLSDAAATFTNPALLLAGIGVGLCSSVIPYVCDQLAMARLPRATFALLLSLLPASATAISLVILGQRPHLVELVGIGLIVGGVAVHHEASDQ